jgi:hypothetical protein
VRFATGEFTRGNGSTGDIGAVFLAYRPTISAGAETLLPENGSARASEFISAEGPTRAAAREIGDIALAGLDSGATLPDALTQARQPVQTSASVGAPAQSLPGAASASPIDDTEAVPAPSLRALRTQEVPPAPANNPVDTILPLRATSFAAGSPPSEAVMVAARGTTSVAVGDPLRDAIAILSRPSETSLNTAGLLRAGTTARPALMSAMAPTSDDVRLDRMIAAIAAFQSGADAGTSPVRTTAAETALAMLAPAI